MNYTQADHVWFIERIEAYLGGDLAGDELARFESHAAACLPCEAKLGEGSRADAALRELFAAHRPGAGLEDRAIVGVRTSLDQHRPRLLLNPKVRRAARVAAASLVIAAMGYVGKIALDGGSLSRFNPGRLFVKSPKEVVSDLSALRSARPDRFAAATGNAGEPFRPPAGQRPPSDAPESAQEKTAIKAAITYEFDQAVNGATDAVVKRDAAAARTQLARAKAARNSRPAEFSAEELAVFDSRIAEAQSRQEQTEAATTSSEQKATSDRIAVEEKTRRLRESREKTLTVDALATTAQQSIRDANYKEALGTIDQILIVDPNNAYARGVRPLVQDKATLALARGDQRDLDEKMGRSLNRADEKALEQDILRYPADWAEISEVRGRTAAPDHATNTEISGKQVATARGYSPSGGGDPALQTTHYGRLSRGTEQAAEGRPTVSVPDGGTLLLGGQVLDGTVVEHRGFGGGSTGNGTGYGFDAGPKGTQQKESGALAFNAFNGGTLDVNGNTSTMQLRNTAALTKAGSGTVILNGENSYTGGTTIDAGTMKVNVAVKPALTATGGSSFGENLATGVVASSGSPPADVFYAYFDKVKAPQPAVAQHVKLGDVASADRGSQQAGDNNWALRTTVAFDGKVDKDGESKNQGLGEKASAAAHEPAIAETEQRGTDGRAKLRPDGEKLGLPALQTGREEKGKRELAEVQSNVEQTLRTVVLSDSNSDAVVALKLPAQEQKDAVKANTDLYSLGFKNTQDLKTDVADSLKRLDVHSGDPNAIITPLKVEDVSARIQNSHQLEDPIQFALVNQTATTAPSTQNTSAGIPAVGGEQPPAPVQRKIIRNGDVIFEVDSFDSSYMQIGKIVAEEGGYIGTTDSEKLPNGKVKGTITVRVPPDRLDVLILKLRGLGDLKNQRIAAQDVTKQFVDSESLLRADRAMEKRLIDLITNGKGEVKDLVAAEKELGNYREKIEQLEGELRYLQSMVSLSTLNITLFERDIKTPTAAFEAETIDTAIETEEVEKARADAIKSVEDAKGRIIESQMKRFEAGQLQATLVAEVAPENAGPVIDRLKQLGHVARFDVERKQTTQGGQGAPVGLKLEKRATVFKVSIYNLANIAPRETVNVSLAAEDVEKAYKAILGAAEMEEVVNGVTVKVGRVVSSSLNSQRADQTTGNITIEVRADRAAVVEAAIRSAGGTGGEVMHLTVTENPDANNVTRAKRGYVVTLASLSSVAPRETAILSVAAKDVPTLYQTLMAQLQDGKDGKGRGKVYASRLEEQDRQNVEAFVDFEIPRGESANIEALLNSGTTSDVFRRNVTRSPDVTSTLDSKVRMQVSILNVGRLRPREESAFTIEVGDPEASLLAVQGIATGAGGRMYEPHLNKDESGKIEGQVAFDVPLSAAAATADKLRALGTVRQSRSLTNESVPAGTLAKARFDVTVINAKQLVAANHGVGARIREGVGTSLDALLLLLEWVIVVAPFVLVLWLVWKLFRRGKKTPAIAAKPVAG